MPPYWDSPASSPTMDYLTSFSFELFTLMKSPFALPGEQRDRALTIV